MGLGSWKKVFVYFLAQKNFAHIGFCFRIPFLFLFIFSEIQHIFFFVISTGRWVFTSKFVFFFGMTHPMYVRDNIIFY